MKSKAKRAGVTVDVPVRGFPFVGAVGWFTKSMRMVEIVEKLSGDRWVVRTLDAHKRMTATTSGLAPLDSVNPL